MPPTLRRAVHMAAESTKAVAAKSAEAFHPTGAANSSKKRVCSPEPTRSCVQIIKRAAACNATAAVVLAQPPAPAEDPSVYRRLNKSTLKAKLIKNYHVEANIVDVILGSILDTPPGVRFEDVVGQDAAVKLLRERVVYPSLNPNVSR